MLRSCLSRPQTPHLSLFQASGIAQANSMSSYEKTLKCAHDLTKR